MIRALLSIVLLSMLIPAIAQDTALDFFNRASRQYVKQDKLTALKTLDKGLENYPGDPRLLKLAEELLKEDEQQQQQEQQQKKDEEQKENDQQKKDQQKDKDDKDDKEKENGQNEKKEEQQQGQQQKPEPGTIDPQDARRILDALNRQEKDVQDKVRMQQRPARRVPIEKDW